MEVGMESSELDFRLAHNTPADHRTVPAGENGWATRSIGLLKARDTVVERRSSGSGDGPVVGKGHGVEGEQYMVAFGEQARMDRRYSESGSRSLQGLQTCNSLVDTQKLVGGKSWVLFGAHKGHKTKNAKLDPQQACLSSKSLNFGPCHAVASVDTGRRCTTVPSAD